MPGTCTRVSAITEGYRPCAVAMRGGHPKKKATDEALNEQIRPTLYFSNYGKHATASQSLTFTQSQLCGKRIYFGTKSTFPLTTKSFLKHRFLIGTLIMLHGSLEQSSEAEVTSRRPNAIRLRSFHADAWYNISIQQKTCDCPSFEIKT